MNDEIDAELDERLVTNLVNCAVDHEDERTIMSEKYWKARAERAELDRFNLGKRVDHLERMADEALASRQQCPYVVTSRGGTSHCSLAERESSQRVPEAVRRLPEQWRNDPPKNTDDAAYQLERTIAESGGDHE